MNKYMNIFIKFKEALKILILIKIEPKIITFKTIVIKRIIKKKINKLYVSLLMHIFNQ